MIEIIVSVILIIILCRIWYRAGYEDAEKYTKKVEYCESCGIYPADLPSKKCCGCNEYGGHQC